MVSKNIDASENIHVLYAEKQNLSQKWWLCIYLNTKIFTVLGYMYVQCPIGTFEDGHDSSVFLVSPF